MVACRSISCSQVEKHYRSTNPNCLLQDAVEVYYSSLPANVDALEQGCMACVPCRLSCGPDTLAALVAVVQAPDDEPVWRQLLRLHLHSKDPGVVQQAAAVMAE